MLTIVVSDDLMPLPSKDLLCPGIAVCNIPLRRFLLHVSCHRRLLGPYARVPLQSLPWPCGHHLYHPSCYCYWLCFTSLSLLSPCSFVSDVLEDLVKESIHFLHSGYGVYDLQENQSYSKRGVDRWCAWSGGSTMVFTLTIILVYVPTLWRRLPVLSAIP